MCDALDDDQAWLSSSQAGFFLVIPPIEGGIHPFGWVPSLFWGMWKLML